MAGFARSEQRISVGSLVILRKLWVMCVPLQRTCGERRRNNELPWLTPERAFGMPNVTFPG